MSRIPPQSDGFEQRALSWWQAWNVKALTQACKKGAADRAAVAYWSGVASFMREDADALEWLERAYALHVEGTATRRCMRDAATAVMICVIDVGAQRNVDEWCRRMRLHASVASGKGTSHAKRRNVPSTEQHEQIWQHIGNVCAGVLKDQKLPTMLASARWLRRQLEPLQQGLTVHERLIVAQVLVNYDVTDTQDDAFESLRINVESAPQFEAAAPLMQARWLYTYGFAKYHAGEPSKSEQAWSRAAALSSRQKLRITTPIVALAQLRLEVDRGNLARAVAIERDIDDRWGGGRESQFAQLEQMRARLKLLEQLPTVAHSLLLHAIATATKSGATTTECATYHADLIQVFVAMDQVDEAARLADNFVAQHKRRNKTIFRCYAMLLRAWVRKTTDPDASDKCLADGLSCVRELNLLYFFRLQPRFAADLCALALTRQIERTFVLDVIALRKLRAPVEAADEWPRRFWVQLLGAFELRRDGVRTDAPRSKPTITIKPVQKPLEVLQLLACQPDMTLPIPAVGRALWPQRGTNASRQRGNAEENISRLRTYLGEYAAVIVEESQVRLHHGLVGSDVHCRRLLINRLQAITFKIRGLKPGAELPDLREAATLIAAIRKLSRGDLLPGAAEVEWVNDARAACAKDMKRFRSLVAVLPGHGGKDGFDDEMLT